MTRSQPLLYGLQEHQWNNYSTVNIALSMQIKTLQKKPDKFFQNWRKLIHDNEEERWEGILNKGNPETNKDYTNDLAGFTAAMNQYILTCILQGNAKTLQINTMRGDAFKFKKGANVADHISCLCTIVTYTIRLPGIDTINDFKTRLLIFKTFPKAW